VIKLKYSDFIVNEVDVKGKKVEFNVELMNNEIKNVKDGVALRKKEKLAKKIKSLEATDESIQEEVETLVKSISNTLSEYINEEKLSLMAMLSVSSKGNDEVDISVNNLTKIERTSIHQFIRTNFENLESRTKEKDGVCQIIVSRKNNKSNQGKRRWNQSKSVINKFVLYKENMTTAEAINFICRKLKVPNRSFGYAGMKDKRGITVQEVTTTLTSERLLHFNNFARFVKIGNFSETDSRLQLGDLQGNVFQIILRDVQIKNNCLLFCEYWKEKGFINYFGLQRFGSLSTPTYEVGKAIFKSDWSKAIDLILESVTSKLNEVDSKKLKNWQNENLNEILSILPHSSSLESHLLKSIIKYGKNQLSQAISSISRNTRSMYLHSYQSFVWNRLVSKRIEKFGFDVVPGDLVQIQNSSNENDSESKKLKMEDEFGFSNTKDCSVKLIRNKDEAEKYQISDVVLPLPGCEMIYPKYEDFCWYKKLIEEDEMKMNCFDQKVLDCYLNGGYRKIISYPKNLEYEVIKHNKFDEQLNLSDLEIAENKQLSSNTEDGKFTSLRLCFQLPTSSYATVALREITKSDLSPLKQKLLTETYQVETEK